MDRGAISSRGFAMTTAGRMTLEELRASGVPGDQLSALELQESVRGPQPAERERLFKVYATNARAFELKKSTFRQHVSPTAGGLELKKSKPLAKLERPPQATRSVSTAHSS